jgi:hypothetical protein
MDEKLRDESTDSNQFIIRDCLEIVYGSTALSNHDIITLNSFIFQFVGVMEWVFTTTIYFCRWWGLFSDLEHHFCAAGHCDTNTLSTVLLRDLTLLAANKGSLSHVEGIVYQWIVGQVKSYNNSPQNII